MKLYVMPPSPRAFKVIALKNHLDAMQDSISDVRSSLNALTDFLLREDEQ